MPLLDDLRQQNPNLANYSDDQLKRALRQQPQFKYLEDQEFDAYVGGQPAQAQQEGEPGFGAGLSAGLDQMQAMGGGLVMAAGEKLGSEGMWDAGREIYTRNMEEAGENALGYGFTDLFSDPDTSAWQWAKYTAGNLLPMLATSVAGGGAGGIGARLLAGNVAKQAATRAGQAIGASAASTGMETGAIMGEVENADVALAHGSVAGALDALPIMRALRKFGGDEIADQAAGEIATRTLDELRRTAGRGTAAAAGRGSLTQMLAEASTEGLQGLIGQHAEYWVENNGETLLNNLGEVDVKAMIDEAAAGGLMGGLMGAPVGIAERGQARKADAIIRARQQVAEQGGDSLDQAQAAQQAEQITPDDIPQADPAVASDLGNRLQMSMGELDDLQSLARGSSYQGQTRLRNISTILDRAERAYEDGNVEQARRLTERADGIARNLRASLEREGSAERPARVEGELVDGEPGRDPAGYLGQDGRRLPPGDPSTIYAEGPTADRTQYDPQARNVRRDERMAAQQEGADRLRETVAGQRPQLTDSGTIYGQGPVAGNANTGLDQPFADPRFAPRQDAEASRTQGQAAAARGEAETVHTMPDGSTMAGPEHEGAVPGTTRPAEPVDAARLRGEPIDGEWRAFSPESGTRDIPRAEMPQIKAEHRGALANFLSARGIQSRPETVSADSLKPTQREFSEERVQAAKERKGDRAILVSSDGHVVDGHHQWLARADQGEDVRVIRLNAPIDEVLEEAREFPSSEVDGTQDASTPVDDGLQRRTDGQPFATSRTAMASGYARRAQRQGRSVEAVEVDGGYALRISESNEATSPASPPAADEQPAPTAEPPPQAEAAQEAEREAEPAEEAPSDAAQVAEESSETATPQDDSADDTASQQEQGAAQDTAQNDRAEDETEQPSAQDNDPEREEAIQSLMDQGYSLNPAPRADSDGQPPRADDIAAALEGSKELADARVIQSVRELPPHALMGMAIRGIRPSDVRGMYIGGDLYVIADNLSSLQEGIAVAVHEAVGHKGMRAVLGAELEPVMLSLYRNLPNSPEGRQALAEVRRDYPFLDPAKREDRITIAEEMVAHLLEAGHRPKAWQRAVAKIREMLRRAFPMVAWTYTDVLALGEQSREWLRKRQAENPEGREPAYAMREAGDRGLDPQELATRLREAYPGLKLDLVGSRDVITVSRIVIPDGERGQGAGTEVMRRLSGWADASGKTLALTPSSDFGGSRRRLAGFYKRLGFVENKGGSRDYTISEGMYRLPEGGDPLFSLRSKQRAAFEQAFDDFTDADRAAAAKIGSRTPPQRAMAWFKEHADRAGLKIRQGMVDRVAALKEVDEQLYGESALGENINRSSWVLARMSNAANGALHAMLHNGRIRLDAKEKVITLQDGDAKGLGEVLGRLGSAAEIERFMGWIAGNRADQLSKDGRENLFDVGDIEAMKGWNRGTLEDGSSREQRYQEVFEEFQQYRDDVLAVAEQSGIISSDQREMWAEEFYVPFYRLSEEKGAPTGQMATSGLSRQQAYKRLKGGTQNLNDLLQNTMMNFHHLLDASLKNQAAVQAVENAKQLGMVEKVPESNRDTKKSTFVMEGGKKVFYEIDDPLVFQALTALAHPGMNSTAMRVMRTFKRVFTNLTTTTPQFMVANLIRDSLQAAATNDVSKNAFKNVIDGAGAYRDQRTRAQMMAAGASFNFGHLFNSNPDELRAQLTRNMRDAKLVDGPYMIPGVMRAGWAWWNDVNNAAENLNRAAIYSQNRDKGELRAAFEARDLIDFSAHGAWPAVRILIDIVPFLNARIQGLDKIYRSGVKPGASVVAEAFGHGKANVTDKQAAARFWTVTGALAAATVALYLHNQDDEEYQKLEDWQKDTYWFIRFGDQAFFIPKPFEVGAIATMAERITEQFVDDKATGQLFRERLAHMMTDTFSFSPVPQAMQPALDIYANYDAFTQRPIESMGMDRLSPELRRRASTSKAGEWISKGLNATVGAIGDPDKNPLALSPVQVDHLIGGYLGQVGTWVASSGDVAWNVATGQEDPARRWYEHQPIRRFYKNLGDEDRYTKYGTVFYEGLREAGRAYADVKELREMGRLADAAEAARTNREMLALRKPLNRAQSRLRRINQQIDIIRRSNLDGEIKRQRIDRLSAVKNQIQRALGERVLEARAD